MCHTDLLVRDSRPESLPAVLGHEGAGIVRETGSEVRGLAAGDKVVLSFPSCGSCIRCRTGRSAYCDSIAALKFRCTRPDGSVATTDARGRPVGDHFFGQSSFGTLAVAYARSAVKVPDDVDLRIAGAAGLRRADRRGHRARRPAGRPRLVGGGLRRGVGRAVRCHGGAAGRRDDDHRGQPPRSPG